MIVTCPNCVTKFNLPTEHAKPNTKVRCSVCKHIFTLPEDTPNIDFAIQTSEEKTPKKKQGVIKKILLILLILAIGSSAYIFIQKKSHLASILPFFNKTEKNAEKENPIQLIALRGVVQYNIKNEKLGDISVIEGKAINGFPDPRELIRLEASLYDKDGKLLVSKQQLAGTSVSLFQLQVLGEQELERALTNKIDVLANNTNIPSKGEVPFMIVFYNPPANASEFGVKVIDARYPPKQ